MEHDYTLEWFRFANRDLKTAEFLLDMHPQPYEIICYQCEQAVEKFLKGFLLYQGVRPPKIHETDKLCVMCAEYNPEFESILDECETLTQYGVSPRYPYEIEVEEHHVKQALACAQKISTFEPLLAIQQELEQAQSEIAQEQKLSDGPEIKMV